MSVESLIIPDTLTGKWKFIFNPERWSFCPHSKRILEFSGTKKTNLKSLLMLLSRDERRKLVREFKFACASGRLFDSQLKITTPGRTEKWIRITGVISVNKWQNPEKVFGLIEDVTHNIFRENVNMAIINHEFRTPLASAKLYTQMISKLFANKDPKLEFLKKIDLNIDFMHGLIERYLVSYSDDSKKDQLNFSLFDLNHLIDNFIIEYKYLYPGYKFYKAPTGQSLIKADKFKIMQVLNNYLSNAVKYSPPSSCIMITLTNNRNNIEVAVRDWGIGIVKGQEYHIFEKFYRSKQSNVQQINGEGLGLYLVKEIISRHGGTVRAEKATDKGSIFYFSLPLTV